jgi:hypothetical protein
MMCCMLAQNPSRYHPMEPLRLNHTFSIGVLFQSDTIRVNLCPAQRAATPYSRDASAHDHRLF